VAGIGVFGDQQKRPCDQLFEYLDTAFEEAVSESAPRARAGISGVALNRPARRSIIPMFRVSGAFLAGQLWLGFVSGGKQ
jgi:hypothetical protein